MRIMLEISTCFTAEAGEICAPELAVVNLKLTLAHASDVPALGAEHDTKACCPLLTVLEA